MASEQVDSLYKGGSMEHVEAPPGVSTDKYKRNVNAKSVVRGDPEIGAVPNR